MKPTRNIYTIGYWFLAKLHIEEKLTHNFLNMKRVALETIQIPKTMVSNNTYILIHLSGHKISITKIKTHMNSSRIRKIIKNFRDERVRLSKPVRERKR